jgi:hypothetical protein
VFVGTGEGLAEMFKKLLPGQRFAKCCSATGMGELKGGRSDQDGWLM